MLLCIAFAAALTRAVDTHYLDTIAGADGDSSTVNGAYTVARFSKPTGVAINYGENGLYIAEYHSHRVRWMSFSTFATGDFAGNGAPGSATGPMTGGCLWYPRAMLFSSTHQRLFVANHGTAQVRAIDVAAATISIVAGSTPGASDGTPGQFAAVNGPSGFELSLDETVLYVSDRMNRAVRAVAPSGGHMSTVVGALEASGDSDGHATNAARLSFPWGLAMRKKRNTLFIFENGCIRQWVLATNMVSTFAGACLTPGFADLPGVDARFTEARGGVWDADEDGLYIMERAGHRIRHITLGRIMEVRTVAGTGVGGSVDGPTGVSQLKDPSHMVMDRFNGGVIIADTQNDEIRLLTPRWKSTVHAGTLGAEGTISVPHSIVYHDGMLYGSSGRSCIYRLSTATTPATPAIVVGTHGSKGNVDATGAAALMDDPIVSGVDASGAVAYLYFSSYGHRVMRRADMNTWATSRVAGAPDSLAAVDGAYGANRISVCMSFARIKGGLGFFVDRWAHAVRTIDLNGPARTVTTLAGGLNIDDGLDGVGLNARFSSPFAMAVRKWHTVYIMELIAHRLRHLDLVTLAVTTLSAGDGKGKGGPTLADSKFVLPGFLSFSAAQDQLFIPEHGSNALRAIALEPSTVADDDSRVTTLIGRAGAELAVDRASNGGGLLARSKCTASVGRAPGGVFAVDHAGHTLRRVTPNAADPSGSAAWRVKNVAGMKTAEAACVASTSTVDGPQASGRITMPAGLAVDVATNSLFMSDHHGRRVRRVDLFTFDLSTVAGSGVSGSTDAAGLAATFHLPDRMAIDAQGRALYVIDSQRIRKVTIGAYAVTTLFTSSTYPRGPSPYSDGTLLFTHGCQVKRVPKAGGAASVVVGSTACGYLDGDGATAMFASPVTTAIDEARKLLYVGELHHAVIRAVDLETRVVWTVAGVPGETGFNNGDGGAGRLQRLVCMSISPTGHELYVSEYYHDNLRVVSTATGSVSMMAGAPSVVGDADGSGAEARFNEPYDTAVHPITGDVYVASFRTCDVRVISRGPWVRAIAGLPDVALHTDAPVGADVRLAAPSGGGYDGKTQMLYFADDASSTIRRMHPTSGATATVAGVATVPPDVIDGVGTAARLSRPWAAWVDTPRRGFYFGEYTHGTLRRMDLDTFEVTLVAGKKSNKGGVDGALGANELSRVAAIQPTPVERFAGPRTLLFTDRENHAVRELDESTTVVRTVLGKLGVSGRAGGVGANARLHLPMPLVTSRRGRCLYLISGYQLLRVEWPTFAVAAVAGVFSTSASVATDGIGESARFHFASHIAAVPDESRLMITEWTGPGGGLIREFVIDTNEVRTASAASGVVRDGPLSAARFLNPWGAWTGHPTMMHTWGRSQAHAVDMSSDRAWVAVPDGTWTVQTINTKRRESYGANHAGMALDCGRNVMYIADSTSHTVSTFNMTSHAMTVVVGVADSAGDGALLNAPEHLLLSRDTATLYVAEFFGHRVRRLSTSSWSVSMVAGSDTSTSGADDGVGTAARFHSPQAMVFETADERRMFVADRYNHAIRAIDMATAAVTTIAGEKGTKGFRDGPAATALVAEPMGLAMRRSTRTLYVGERASHVIRAVDVAAMVVYVAAGQPWSDGFNDGVASVARIWWPGTLSLSPDERRLFIAIVGRSIRVLDLERNTVESIAGRGTDRREGGGNGTVARFQYAWYVYAHPTDNRFVFASDSWSGNQRLVLLSENGPQAVAGHYDVKGTRFEAHDYGRMSYPVGVVYDTRRHVLYVSSHNACILHSVDPNTGQHRLAAGAVNQCGVVNGNARSARLAAPTHMAYHPGRDTVFISEDGPRRIRTFAPGAALVGHLAGDGAGAVDHTVGLSVRFGIPGGLECGAGGLFLYVADSANHAIRRTHMDTGATDTVAGVLGSSGHIDGIGAAARLTWPFGLTRGVKHGEILYAASTMEDTAIRRIDVAMWRVTTVPNTHGFLQDLANVQIDLELDDDEASLFVLESNGARLQRLDLSNGRRSIVLGGPQNDTSSGFGPFAGGSYARMHRPYAMRKHDGRLFIANGLRHNVISLKIDSLAQKTSLDSRGGTSSMKGSDVPFTQSVPSDVSGGDTFDDRTQYEVTTIAGSPGTSGYVQGTSTTARFTQPTGIAIDTQEGVLFVASFGHRAVQTIDMRTNAVSHFVGSAGGAAGTTDATGGAARFTTLEHLTIDVAGRVLYLSDLQGHTVRAATLPAGVVTTVAGTPGVSGYLTGTPGFMNGPSGLALDLGRGAMYVADRWNCGIRRVALGTGALTNMASPPDPSRCGFADGPPGAARFNEPAGIVYRKADDSVVIADTKTRTIREMDVVSGVVTTLAGQQNTAGATNGFGPEATFGYPAGLALSVDESMLFIVEWDPRIVRSFEFATTRVAFVAGQRRGSSNSEFNNGRGDRASFSRMWHVATDPRTGMVYIPDHDLAGVRALWRRDSGVQSRTLSGRQNIRSNADGVGTQATHDLPIGVVSEPSLGIAWVLDHYRSTLRRVDLRTMAVATVVGSTPGFSDGVGTAALMQHPYHMDIDRPSRTLYVADRSNVRIRRIQLGTFAVSTIAGQATAGLVDGPLGTNRLRKPVGVALDRFSTQAFVADSTAHAIRRVPLASPYHMSTTAGSLGAAGTVDGFGSAARLDTPTGLSMRHRSGEVYFTEPGARSLRVLNLATRGVRTLITQRLGDADGDIETTARLRTPYQPLFSPSENVLYIGTPYVVSAFDVQRGRLEVLLGGHSGESSGIGGAAKFKGLQGIGLGASPGTLIGGDAWSQQVVEVANIPEGTSTGRDRVEPDALDTRRNIAEYHVATIAGRLSSHDTSSPVPPGRSASEEDSDPGDNIGGGFGAVFAAAASVAVLPNGTAAFVTDAKTGSLRKVSLSGSFHVTTVFQTMVPTVSPPVYPADKCASPTAAVSFSGVTSMIASSDGRALFMGNSVSAAVWTVSADTGALLAVTRSQDVLSISDIAFDLSSPASITSSDHVSKASGAPYTVKSSTNVYAADSDAHVVHRMDTAAGTTAVVVGALRHAGTADGTALGGALLSRPSGVAATAGALFIACRGSHSVRRVSLPSWTVSTLLGSGGYPGSVDGGPMEGSFASPGPMALSTDGAELFVSDRASQTIRRIDTASTVFPFVTTVAGVPTSVSDDRAQSLASLDQGRTSTVTSPMVDGRGSAVRLAALGPVAIDPSNDQRVLFLSDNAVREVSRSAARVVTVAGDPAVADPAAPLVTNGRAFEARYTEVSGVAYYTAADDGDLIFVADSARHALHTVTLSTGTVAHVAGHGTAGSADGVGLGAHFSSPQAVLAAPRLSTVFVFEHGNGRETVRSYNVDTASVTTICGAGPGGVDATGLAARFLGPHGPALSGDSAFILTAAMGNHAVRKVHIATRVVTTAAGLIGASGDTDGPALTTARLTAPSALSYDTARNFVFVACGSPSHVIRLLDLTTATLSTVAGAAGSPGSADGLGSMATFDAPSAVALGADGSLLVAEGGRSSSNVASSLRRVTFNDATIPSMGRTTVETLTTPSLGAHGGPLHAASFGRIGQLSMGRAMGGVVVVADRDARSVRVLQGIAGFSRPPPPVVTEVFPPTDSSSLVTAFGGVEPNTFVETIVGKTARGGVVAHGPQSAARLDEPRAVAYSAKTKALFVADKTTIRYVAARTLHVTLLSTVAVYDLALDDSSGVLFAAAGTSVLKYGVSNAPSTASVVSYITGLIGARGVALQGGTPSSALLVADTAARIVLRVVSGAVVTTYGSGTKGYKDGAAAVAMFDSPMGLTVAAGRSAAFVADQGSATVRMIAIATGTVSTVLGRPYTMHVAAGLLTAPVDVLFVAAGSGGSAADQLFVLDGSVVHTMDPEAAHAASVVIGRAGDPGAGQDGPGAGARFRGPQRMIAGDGGIIVADAMNHVVKHVTRHGTGSATLPLRVDTLSGNKTNPNVVIDGRRAVASMALPSGVLVSADNTTLYVADYTGDCLRAVDIKTGDMAVLAGQPGIGGVTSGLPAVRSLLTNPGFMALAPDGASLFFSQVWAHQVHRLDLTTMTSHLVAGSVQGAVDGAGPAAQFYKPQGIAASPDGATLFVVDSFNHAFRSVDVATAATATRAGVMTAPGASDGVGSAARFRAPMGCVFDRRYGVVYVADYDNHKVRKVTLGGSYTVSTLAGHGSVGAQDGAAGTAQFSRPIDLTMNAHGAGTEHALYVADTDNNAIRRIDLTAPGSPSFGAVTTIAGLPGVQGSVDGPLSQATLSRPQGITTDGKGRLFVTDTRNTVRVVSGVGATSLTPSLSDSNSATVPRTVTRSAAATTTGTSTLLKSLSATALRSGSASSTATPHPSPTVSKPSSATTSLGATGTASPSVVATPTPSVELTTSRTGATLSASRAASGSLSIIATLTYSNHATATPSVALTTSRSALGSRSSSRHRTGSRTDATSPTLSKAVTSTGSHTTSAGTSTLSSSVSGSASGLSWTRSMAKTTSVSMDASWTKTAASLSASRAPSPTLSGTTTLTDSSVATATLSVALSSSASARLSTSTSEQRSSTMSFVRSTTPSLVGTSSRSRSLFATKSSSASKSMSGSLTRTGERSVTSSLPPTSSSTRLASMTVTLAQSPSTTATSSPTLTSTRSLLSREETLSSSASQSHSIGSLSSSWSLGNTASRTATTTDSVLRSVSTTTAVTQSIGTTATPSVASSPSQSILRPATSTFSRTLSRTISRVTRTGSAASPTKSHVLAQTASTTATLSASYSTTQTQADLHTVSPSKTSRASLSASRTATTDRTPSASFAATASASRPQTTSRSTGPTMSATQLLSVSPSPSWTLSRYDTVSFSVSFTATHSLRTVSTTRSSTASTSESLSVTGIPTASATTFLSLSQSVALSISKTALTRSRSAIPSATVTKRLADTASTSTTHSRTSIATVSSSGLGTGSQTPSSSWTPSPAPTVSLSLLRSVSRASAHTTPTAPRSQTLSQNVASISRSLGTSKTEVWSASVALRTLSLSALPPATATRTESKDDRSGTPTVSTMGPASSTSTSPSSLSLSPRSTRTLSSSTLSVSHRSMSMPNTPAPEHTLISSVSTSPSSTRRGTARWSPSIPTRTATLSTHPQRTAPPELRGAAASIFGPGGCSWRAGVTFLGPIVFALAGAVGASVFIIVRRRAAPADSIRTWRVTPAWRALIRQHAWVGLVWPCHHYCAPTHVVVFAARVAVMLLTAALLVGSSMGHLGHSAASRRRASPSVPWFELLVGIAASAAATATQPVLQRLFWIVRRVHVPARGAGVPVLGKSPQDLLVFGTTKVPYIGVSRGTYATLDGTDFDGVGPDEVPEPATQIDVDDDGDGLAFPRSSIDCGKASTRDEASEPNVVQVQSIRPVGEERAQETDGRSLSQTQLSSFRTSLRSQRKSQSSAYDLSDTRATALGTTTASYDVVSHLRSFADSSRFVVETPAPARLRAEATVSRWWFACAGYAVCGLTIASFQFTTALLVRPWCANTEVDRWTTFGWAVAAAAIADVFAFQPLFVALAHLYRTFVADGEVHHSLHPIHGQPTVVRHRRLFRF